MPEKEASGKPDASEQRVVAVKSLALGLAMTAAIFAIDINIPLGVAGGVPYISVILLAQWHGGRREIIYAALLCSLLTVAGFFLSPSGGESWKVLSNRSLALYAIWLTAILALQRIKIEAEREKALLEREDAVNQLKILRGFLPICASCKKIRDDDGDWTHLESYIHNHSEAQLSHGICPDCAQKLYPEYYSADWYKKNDKGKPE